MTKDIQDLFYEAISKQFLEHRRNTMTTISDLVRMTGEQYNTIQSIENGGRFMFHHALWMMKEGMDINELIQNAAKEVDEAIKKIQVEDINEQKGKGRSGEGPKRSEEPVRKVTDFF